MAGLGLMNRRRAIASSPVKGEMGAILANRIGWYTFEGRNNNDADRDIVMDKSGNGLPMQVVFSNWGTTNGITTTGYYDDCLCSSPTNSSVNYALIPLIEPLDENFTIIVERVVYANVVMNEYSSLLGSVAVEVNSTSPLLIEYRENSASSYARSSHYRGLKLASSASSSPIVWMTKDSYTGQHVEGSYTNNYLVKELYLGRVRINAGTSQRFVIKSVHLFNKQLTDEQILSYIHTYIDPTFTL